MREIRCRSFFGFKGLNLCKLVILKVNLPLISVTAVPLFFLHNLCSCLKKKVEPSNLVDVENGTFESNRNKEDRTFKSKVYM